MMKRIFFLAGILFSFICNAQIPLPLLRDTTGGGKYITRTMHLLESSSPEKRNTVKILVYGQSISEQEWWLTVKQKLEERYPHANLVMINRAIGGFSSQMLWKTVEMDVTSFYPDLVLFHVYGSHIDYETIIKTIRSRTAAEVVIQTDHITNSSEVSDYDAHQYDLNFSSWENKMSFIFEPGFADKYKCELIKVRKHWIDYLKDNPSFSPGQFLRDGVHLNSNGNALMAAIIEPNLRRNAVYSDPDPLGLVKTFYAGVDFSLASDTLIFPFEGNKVEVIAPDDAAAADSFLVFVDGVPPESFQGVYNYTRPYDKIGGSFPWSMGCWYYLQHTFPWNKEEEWACQILTINQAYDNFTFKVTGSVTGNDGSGSGQQNFVSSSGRVIISKDDWHIKRTHDVTGYTVQPGYTFYWKTYPMAQNQVIPSANQVPATENIIPLFQGIANTKHVLMLVKKGNRLPVQALRVFRPYWDRKDTFYLQVTPAGFTFQRDGGEKSLTLSSNTYWKITTGSSWLNANITSWSDDAVITISADKNTGITRTDTIRIEGKGLPAKEIVVNQEGTPAGIAPGGHVEHPVSLYPNPARNHIIAHSFAGKILSYQIVGADGRILNQEKSSSVGLKDEFRIELGDLHPGTYWLRIFQKDGFYALPFVKL